LDQVKLDQVEKLGDFRKKMWVHGSILRGG
jgi:hypothetical protein